MKIDKQTNKNKAKLKFYERIKVFLSKKCENTDSTLWAQDALWTSDGRLFFTFQGCQLGVIH